MNDFSFIENDKLRRQMEFLVKCDELKHIMRRTVLVDASRQENDAEHSWHLAITAMLFEEYAPKDIDMYKVIRMVIVHDLVEIYAGDTFAYDSKGNESKRERELAAADKLFGSLKDSQGDYFRSLWDEFEERKTLESMYAASVDCFQPLVHNYMTNGHTWRGNDVDSSMVYRRMEPIRTTLPEIWKVVEQIIEGSVAKGILKR